MKNGKNEKYTPKRIEFMAPAGSWEMLVAALDAGADSVYLGVEGFNMRATAARNFSIDELADVVGKCHERNVKVFITVNTVLCNDELKLMYEVIDAVKESGADAAICADIATILYARQKGVSVHVSTQLSVANTQSVKFYSQYADRIVLARELNLAQVKQIVKDIKRLKIIGPSGKLMEIEIFGHGALCVAVSGRCGMSLFCNDLSANKGKCTQICRRKYKVIDVETGSELVVDNNYVMSAADLCTIGMLPEIIDTGVSVLKFEGRGRNAEYVDTVLRVYRQAFDAINSDSYNDASIARWRKRLGTVFNRGQSDGLYHGIKFAKWAGIDGSRATEQKVLAGKVVHYYPKIFVAEIKIDSDVGLKPGEKFTICGNTTGIVTGIIKEMKIDDNLVKIAQKGDLVTLVVGRKVRVGDSFGILVKRKA
ncbi:U32 family peptidase [Candidatus Dojkabacteria bacterium]|nr:U32 family peptidase [Candidatus Dojkabacteria bacterium]